MKRESWETNQKTLLNSWRDVNFEAEMLRNVSKIKGSVAQLYSALDFGSSGWGLESLRGHKTVKSV